MFCLARLHKTGSFRLSLRFNRNHPVSSLWSFLTHRKYRLRFYFVRNVFLSGSFFFVKGLPGYPSARSVATKATTKLGSSDGGTKRISNCEFSQKLSDYSKKKMRDTVLSSQTFPPVRMKFRSSFSQQETKKAPDTKWHQELMAAS